MLTRYVWITHTHTPTHTLTQKKTRIVHIFFFKTRICFCLHCNGIISIEQLYTIVFFLYTTERRQNHGSLFNYYLYLIYILYETGILVHDCIYFFKESNLFRSLKSAQLFFSIWLYFLFRHTFSEGLAGAL